MNDLKNRVIQLISDISMTPASEIEKINNIAEATLWDSMWNMNLILGLEREFGIRCSVEEIGEIKSIDDAVAIITKKKASEE